MSWLAFVIDGFDSMEEQSGTCHLRRTLLVKSQRHAFSPIPMHLCNRQ